MLTVVITIFGIVALITVVLNLLVIIAILKDPLKKLRSVFTYLLVHLCICNFLDGAVSLPIYMYSLSRSKLHKAPPLSYSILLTHSIYAATVFSTFSLSIDRYKAIRDPLSHRNNSSIKQVGFYILGIWLCTLIEFIGYYFLGVRFRNAFQILTFSVMSFANHQESDNDKNETLLSSQEMIEERRITEKAVLNTCKVITGLQMISWLPILVMDSSEMVRPSLPYRKLVVAICISNILSAIGHISDPLVCIFLLKNFKQSIKYLFVRNITQEL